MYIYIYIIQYTFIYVINERDKVKALPFSHLSICQTHQSVRQPHTHQAAGRCKPRFSLWKPWHDLRFFRIMENKMEITISIQGLCRDSIGVMEKKMETTRLSNAHGNAVGSS